MAIDPQPIPYQPQQPPQQNLQFQPGPYASIAAERIAKQPTTLDYMRTVGGVTNDALQNYLAQQRINQQQPLINAQTSDVQSQAQQRQAQTAFDYGGGIPSGPSQNYTPDQGYSVGGSSPAAPQPTDSSYGGGISKGPQQNYTPDHIQGFSQFKASQNQGLSPVQDPYGIGLDMRQIGAKQYEAIRSGLAQQAGGRILQNAPATKSLLGNQNPQDLELSGINAGELLGKGAEVQASANYRNATLGMARDRLDFEKNKTGYSQEQKAQDDFNTATKDIVKEQNEVNTAQQQLDLALKNPIAYNTLPIKMARMMVGSSRINVNELNAMGGSKAVLDKAAQIGKQMASGTMTQDNYSYMKQLIGVLGNANDQAYQSFADLHTKQLGQLNGRDYNTNYRTLTGKDRAQPLLSAEDQAALTWANANPKDLRAIKIKQRLGVQ